MRVIIVSNRLPITFEELSQGLRVVDTAGGLVTGINSLTDHPSNLLKNCKWIGWPGNISRSANRRLAARTLKSYDCLPVFINPSIMLGAYSGFSNKTLWPIFHRFPLKSHYNEDWWTEYVEYNKIFAACVSQIIQKDDVIWVHDYQLMLLPGIIKQSFPNQALGFFLHIPFPDSTNFGLLSTNVREKILYSMLAADLLGFQTLDYLQHFNEVLKVDNVSLNRIDEDWRRGVFPISIDMDKYEDASKEGDVIRVMEVTRSKFNGNKIILSVSRLDYTKGLIESLQAYEKFLEQNGNWLGSVVYLLIIAPSRLDVQENITLKESIDESVERINTKFGLPDWMPISYNFEFNSFEDLVAIYKASDVALINSLADGMNLIAKEYVAARSDSTGVLILSHMAGAARDLSQSILVDPRNIEEIAAAIGQALEMPMPEQQRRMSAMRNYLKRNDIFKWGDDFVNRLLQVATS